MKREVNVTKLVKTAEGLRYCPVVLSANGRIRPDWVLVNGKEGRHLEGAYYLDPVVLCVEVRFPLHPARRRGGRTDEKPKTLAACTTSPDDRWSSLRFG